MVCEFRYMYIKPNCYVLTIYFLFELMSIVVIDTDHTCSMAHQDSHLMSFAVVTNVAVIQRSCGTSPL